MTIEEYLVLNNPREVAALLESHGSRPVNKKNIREIIQRFTDKKGDFAYYELAKIDTPYKRLILSTIEENKSGCSGCGGTCGEKKSNCCGVDGEKAILTTTKEAEQYAPAPAPAPTPEVKLTEKSNSHLLTAGVVLLGVLTMVIIMRK